jgi:glycosyltransferase involved in cell wall biosynthesis
VISVPRLDEPVGRQFLRLSEDLCDRGHSVTILLFRMKDHADASSRSAGSGALTIREWPANATTLADLRFFARVLARVRPDCVIGQMESINATMTLSWLFRVPVRIAWCHMLVEALIADGARRSLPLRIRRRALVYRCATDVVAVSAAALEELVDIFEVPRHKCSVVRNAFESPPQIADASGSGDEHGPVRFITVGRAVATKDHATLVRAFANVARTRDGVLTIVGDGPLRPELERLAEELGVGRSVRFTGTIDHGAVVEELRRSDVYVHPARSDNNPLAIIEAMSLGLPIVATAVGGVPEMITDRRDAMLVAAEDAPAMSARMIELADDRQLRDRMGDAAHTRFLDAFEMSQWVRRARELVEAATEGPS